MELLGICRERWCGDQFDCDQVLVSNNAGSGSVLSHSLSLDIAHLHLNKYEDDRLCEVQFLPRNCTKEIGLQLQPKAKRQRDAAT